MTRHLEDYTVGWICALPIEYAVACEMLDEEFDKNKHETPTVDTSKDPNVYTFGRIHKHNVVIACLPQGRYGLSSAAVVAERLRWSFPTVRFGLMVGIAGGAPSPKHDIRLGDVVVSSPSSKFGGVIQYDFGKTIQSQDFEITGHLAPPPEILLHAVSHLEMLHTRKDHGICETIAAMVEKNRRLWNCRSSKTRSDILCQPSYVHHGERCCCQRFTYRGDVSTIVMRPPRKASMRDPVIHYGLIASASQLMKDANVREALSRKYDVLCFEMEAAGMMNSFPCLVIRGICDYSDTHKNDQWQPHAAAVAAAYAKELLSIITGESPVVAGNRQELQDTVSAPRPGPSLRTSSSDSWQNPVTETDSLREELGASIAAVASRMEPTDVPSSGKSSGVIPGFYTKTSEEVIEYNESGKMVKRTFSETSSFSSANSSTASLHHSLSAPAYFQPSESARSSSAKGKSRAPLVRRTNLTTKENTKYNKSSFVLGGFSEDEVSDDGKRQGLVQSNRQVHFQGKNAGIERDEQDEGALEFDDSDDESENWEDPIEEDDDWDDDHLDGPYEDDPKRFKRVPLDPDSSQRQSLLSSLVDEFRLPKSPPKSFSAISQRHASGSQSAVQPLLLSPLRSLKERDRRSSAELFGKLAPNPLRVTHSDTELDKKANTQAVRNNNTKPSLIRRLPMTKPFGNPLAGKPIFSLGYTPSGHKPASGASELSGILKDGVVREAEFYTDIDLVSKLHKEAVSGERSTLASTKLHNTLERLRSKFSALLEAYAAQRVTIAELRQENADLSYHQRGW